jgi:cyclopropane fatty-acyl-phospholipid synthase-like methyltransferase
VALRVLAFLLGFCLAFPAQAQQGGQHFHRHFDGAEKWSKIFDDPARDAWQKPDEVIRALALQPDASVADLGSGTGYFAVRLARALPQGKIYGADVSADMVKFLNERAAKEKLPNLASHQAGEADARLPAPVDLVLVVDTYHHIAKRSAYFERLKAQLKPGGRVAIIDFRPDSPAGPPPEHRTAPETIIAEMDRAGYRLSDREEFLPRQSFLVFSAR